MTSVSALYSYPLKSSKAISHQSIQVLRSGLLYDRDWAIFNEDNNCLTGRDYPQLLDITCYVTEKKLDIRINDTVQLSIDHNASSTEEHLKVFSYDAYGRSINTKADEWFSNYLKTPCRLLRSDLENRRPVLEKHGGDPNRDALTFADQAPVLIISEATLQDLNERLDDPIGMDRFRPNIVVKGCSAYEEDQWGQILIDDVRFKIIQQCERCVFTTIDPVSKLKHPNSEPLRTMATYRKGKKGGVVIGVHAVPLDEGMISHDASITILS